MSARRAVRSLVDWGRMVKFSHTLFALPFALSAAALATLESSWEPVRLAWVVVAVFGARNAAMGFNRLVDQRIDALNPRTADRELPAGRLGRRTVWIVTAGMIALFVLATERLELLWFAPLALAATLGYSLTKRFTWTSHLVLGVALGLAPVGAWLAIARRLSPTAILLGVGVACWVAGFDLIYACQDVEFDRRAKLHSLPARFGVRGALWTARGMHLASLSLLCAVGLSSELHPLYWLAMAAVLAILVLEHRIVRSTDLSRLRIAFFHLNAAVSVVYFVGVLAALVAGGWGGR